MTPQPALALRRWTVTYEVEHYTNHGSYIETVTREAR